MQRVQSGFPPSGISPPEDPITPTHVQSVQEISLRAFSETPRFQGFEIHSTSPAPSTLPTPREANPLTSPPGIEEQRHKTNAQIQQISQKINYLIPFAIMADLGRIQDPTRSNDLFILMETALQQESPNLKQIFYDKYKDRLSLFQRFKISSFHLFGSSTLLRRIINTHIDYWIDKIREHFIDATWEKKKEMLEGLIHDMSTFLGLYQEATVDFAEVEGRNASLEWHRSNATLRMFGKKSKELYTEFTHTFINHMCPQVPYWNKGHRLAKIVNRGLNWLIHKILHFSLPSQMLYGMKLMKEATEPTCHSFAVGLTEALSECLTMPPPKPTPPSVQPKLSPINEKDLKEFLSHLFDVLEFAQLKDQNEINDLKNRWVKRGFTKTLVLPQLQKPIQDFFHRLADRKFSEELLTQIISVSNMNLVHTEDYSQEDVQKSLHKFSTLVETRFPTLIREAIESSPQEESKVPSQPPFLQNKDLCQQVSETLNQIKNKIEQNNFDIQSDLASILEILSPLLPQNPQNSEQTPLLLAVEQLSQRIKDLEQRLQNPTLNTAPERSEGPEEEDPPSIAEEVDALMQIAKTIDPTLETNSSQGKFRFWPALTRGMKKLTEKLSDLVKKPVPRMVSPSAQHWMLNAHALLLHGRIYEPCVKVFMHRIIEECKSQDPEDN